MFCTHNGVRLRDGFRTNRIGLFLRHRVQAAEHLCNMAQHRGLLLDVWGGDPNVAVDAKTRSWELRLQSIRATTFLAQPHFGLAMRLFQRPPLGRRTENYKTLGDQMEAKSLTVARRAGWKPAPLPEKSAWHVVTAGRKSRSKSVTQGSRSRSRSDSYPSLERKVVRDPKPVRPVPKRSASPAKGAPDSDESFVDASEGHQ